jgi:small subunit ribosomal protein S20
MLSYVAIMPNTKSAKKAVRSSGKKRAHNVFWKTKYKASVKGVKESLTSPNGAEVLKDKLQSMQKILDKAAKEKVIHKNKANRLKSRYARKISAISKTPAKQRKSS